MPKVPAPISPSLVQTPPEPRFISPGSFGLPGAGLQEAGRALRTIASQMHREQQTAILTRAETEAITRLSELEGEALENPLKATEIFQAGAQRVQAEIMGTIENGSTAEAFELGFKQQVARRAAVLRRGQIAAVRVEGIQAVSNALDMLPTEIAAADPINAEALRRKGLGIIMRAKVVGTLTPEQAQESVNSFQAVTDDFMVQNRIRTGRMEEAQTIIEASKHIPADRKRILQSLLDSTRGASTREARSRVTEAIRFVEFSAGQLPANFEAIKAQAPADMVEDIAEIEADAPVMQDFAQLPLLDQEQVLQGTRVGIVDARGLRRFERLSGLHENNLNAIKRGDGLGRAEQLGFTPPLAPLDLSDPNSVRSRLAAADLAGARFGVEVPFVLPRELEALQATFDGGTPDEQVSLMQAIAQSVGSEQLFEIGALLVEDSPDIASAFGVAAEDPSMAVQIIKGRARLRSEELKPELPANDIRRLVADEYGALFADAPNTKNQFILAAKLLYASRVEEDLRFNSDEFKRALRDVAGGVIEFNGLETIPPKRGMERDEFQQLVLGFTEEDLTRFGNGRPVMEGTGTPIRAQDLQDATFTPLGSGRYSLRFRTDGLPIAAVDESGEPLPEGYIINLRGAADAGVAQQAAPSGRAIFGIRGAPPDALQRLISRQQRERERGAIPEGEKEAVELSRHEGQDSLLIPKVGQPRGLRNNNPLNIRLRARNEWINRVPPSANTDGAFEQFLTPADGLRAAAKLIMNHQTRRGVQTVRELAEVWAPRNENDTELYARVVARRAGFSPDAPLNFSDPAILAPVMEAMVFMENGEQPFNTVQIRSAITKAGVGE